MDTVCMDTVTHMQVVTCANVGTLCVDDRLELCVSLYNALGVTDPVSVSWRRPVSVTSPENREYGQLCYLDQPGAHWFTYENYVAQAVEFAHLLQPFGKPSLHTHIVCIHTYLHTSCVQYTHPRLMRTHTVSVYTCTHSECIYMHTL